MVFSEEKTEVTLTMEFQGVVVRLLLPAGEEALGELTTSIEEGLGFMGIVKKESSEKFKRDLVKFLLGLVRQVGEKAMDSNGEEKGKVRWEDLEK